METPIINEVVEKLEKKALTTKLDLYEAKMLAEFKVVKQALSIPVVGASQNPKESALNLATILKLECAQLGIYSAAACLRDAEEEIKTSIHFDWAEDLLNKLMPDT